MDKQFAYQQRAVTPTSMWLLFLFLGWSYGSMGKMGKQIFYYLTLGGIGFWIIYRLFTLMEQSESITNKLLMNVVLVMRK